MFLLRAGQDPRRGAESVLWVDAVMGKPVRTSGPKVAGRLLEEVTSKLSFWESLSVLCRNR